MEPRGLLFISFSEVLGFINMDNVISKRDDFIVDALIYFKPVQRSEYRDDMFSFRGASYCTS